MRPVSVFALVALLALGLSAQVLNPATLGLPGWREGDPIEVATDHDGGFWVRSPAGVLAVDENLRPRPWAAALYLSTAGGLGWRPLDQGFFVVRKSAGQAYLFHRLIPQGIALPVEPPAPADPPPAGEWPWRSVQPVEGVGVDLAGQVWIREEGTWRRHGRVAGALSAVRAGASVWVNTADRVVELIEGRPARSLEAGFSRALLRASGEAVVLVDPESTLIRRLGGNEAAVVWDFWQAVEEEARVLEAELRGEALERLSAAVLNPYRTRFGDFGPWMERLNLGRRVRGGFGNIRARWQGRWLSWRVNPDDRNTERPLDLVIASVPPGMERVLRQAGYQGKVELDAPGARVLWLQFVRGRDVQEVWIVEEP